MSTTAAVEVESTLKILGDLFAHSTLEKVSFRLWEGTLWPDAEPRQATIVLKHARALHSMFAAGTEKGLAEAFLNDAFDVEGDIEAACELADVLAENGQGGWLGAAGRIFQFRRLAGAVPSRTWTGGGDLRGRMHSKKIGRAWCRERV